MKKPTVKTAAIYFCVLFLAGTDIFIFTEFFDYTGIGHMLSLIFSAVFAGILKGGIIILALCQKGMLNADKINNEDRKNRYRKTALVILSVITVTVAAQVIIFGFIAAENYKKLIGAEQLYIIKDIFLIAAPAFTTVSAYSLIMTDIC